MPCQWSARGGRRQSSCSGLVLGCIRHFKSKCCFLSSDGGATFGKPIRVDEGSAIGRVDIVIIDDTSAVVSWMEGTMIKAVRVHSDGTKEPAITIATSSESRSSGFPQMTKAGNQLIFAWTDDKEKNIKIASIYL